MADPTTPSKPGSRFSGRRTNLALLTLLIAAFATGLTGQAVGTPVWGNLIIALHGAVGLSVLLLAPWKTRVAQRGLARRNAKRILSLVLAGLATIVLLTGIIHTTGTVSHIGPFTVLWVHVATALLLIPLVAWHYVARKTAPRSTDLTKRNLLRLGGLTSLAGVLWFGADRTIALAGVAGLEPKVQRFPRALVIRSSRNSGHVMVGRPDSQFGGGIMASHHRRRLKSEIYISGRPDVDGDR